MSEAASGSYLDKRENWPVCDYCGDFIREFDQRCDARDEGVCEP